MKEQSRRRVARLYRRAVETGRHGLHDCMEWVTIRQGSMATRIVPYLLYVGSDDF